MNVKNKIIVVDSCILLYCEAHPTKLEIRKLLRTLVDNKNRLVISELSGFEVMKNAKTENRGYFIKLLDYIPSISIDKNILANSVLLYDRYESKKINHYKKISAGDYLIGGTTLSIKNSLLLTSNRADFCRPIWKIYEHQYITYKLGEKQELLNFYLLEYTI